MAVIKLFLDKRYKSKDKEKQGLYPVKLRVFQANPRKQKLYTTRFELSPNDFDTIIHGDPRGENRVIKKALNTVVSKAEKIESSLDPFDFKLFELRLFEKTNEADLVRTFYESKIKTLTNSGRIGTADNYQCSMKSIASFTGQNDFDKLRFSNITVEFLDQYEAYMIANGKSLSTIGAYLRPLRSLYNDAIKANIVNRSKYPFIKGEFQIPATEAVKKSLSDNELIQLWNAQTATPEQIKAKDFFFLIYFLNGINIKDLAVLKWSNIKTDTIEYYRAKTLRSTKNKLRPITVHINQQAHEIINKYGSKDNPDNLVFDVLTLSQTPEQQHRKVKAFTKYMNQHLKALAKENGFNEEISPYWARHSFASNSLNNGFSIEIISQSLGHTSISTTRAYLNIQQTKLKEMSEANNKFLTNEAV